jgi:hypothetical protein
MIRALHGVWALLLGIVPIMLGNGMHFTLVNLRIEGSIDRSGNCHLRLFLGFLSGARITPLMIQRVWVMRVLQLFGSFMSVD